MRSPEHSTTHVRPPRAPRGPALAALLAALVALAAPAAARAAINVGDVVVTEGDATVGATFTLTRDAPPLSPAVTVAVRTVAATALAPADFTAVDETRTFGASALGATQTQQVTVAVQGDRLDEPTETFRLVVSGPEVADGDALGTIVDDDPAPVVRVDDAPPAPEAGRIAAFPIRLSAPSGRAVSVAYATVDGTATAPSDYGSTAGRVTIPAGATEAVVAAAIRDDAVAEPTESFGLRLSDPAAAALGDDDAAAAILDDDAPGSSGGSLLLGLSSPRMGRAGAALIKVSCPPDTHRCDGHVALFGRAVRRSKLPRLRRERKLVRRAFMLGGGASRTLRLPLSRADRLLLRRRGRLEVRAYGSVEDGTGRAGTRSVNATLVAPKRAAGRRRPR